MGFILLIAYYGICAVVFLFRRLLWVIAKKTDSENIYDCFKKAILGRKSFRIDFFVRLLCLIPGGFMMFGNFLLPVISLVVLWFISGFVVNSINSRKEDKFFLNYPTLEELCEKVAVEQLPIYTKAINSKNAQISNISNEDLKSAKMKYFDAITKVVFNRINNFTPKLSKRCKNVCIKRSSTVEGKGEGLGEIYAVLKEAYVGISAYSDIIEPLDKFCEGLMHAELLDEKLPESSADAANSTKPETPAKEAFSADDHTPRMQFCRRCGKKLDDNLEICSYCGTAVIKEKK